MHLEPPASVNVSPTTTQGDLIVRGASADARLAIGTQGKYVRSNSGATAPEYVALRESYNVRDGTVFQIYDRATYSSTFGLTAGTLYMTSVGLRVGDVVTSIAFCIITASTLPTNWWYVLCNASRLVVAVTADQLTAASGTGEVSLNVGSPYTVTADAQLYVGCMFAATAAATVARSESTSSILSAMVPILEGTSNTGMTTPPAVNDTMNAITAGTRPIWARGK